MKPKPMPASVKVGPHTYSILRKPAGTMPNDNGHVDSNSLEIWIIQRLKRSKAQEILVHELLHACGDISEVPGNVFDEENFVTATAPVLLQVLQENPSLVEYLTQ
jgi:hypothetical protein